MTSLAVTRLEELAKQVRHDLDLLSYPARPWTLPRVTAAGDSIYDVLIVGGGQGGLATAFALARERLERVLVVDENPEDLAGPWLRFARMRTLRTPKHLTGPDLGLPNLTPRSWYEAQYGEGSWERLGLLPKELWAGYLSWYRRTLNLPVRFDTRAGALAWDPEARAWRVPCTTHGKTETLRARRVVLATGIEGSGAWHVPGFLTEHLPADRYAHTRADIDFAQLTGKRVAVVGAGASAFDNAATALDHGASEVRLFFRRRSLVDVNPYRWAEFVGFLAHAGDLADDDKWRFIHQIIRMGQLPPRDTYRRAQEHSRFHLHAGSGVRGAALRDGNVVLATETGPYETDFVVAATGFVTDLALRPELVNVEKQIARWADHYTPPESLKNDDLLRHPYLGRHFEFTEREPGAAPHLRYLFNYTFGGLLSLGFGGASISGMKYSIPRLVSGITGSLFVEDREDYFDTLCAFSEKEF